MSCRSECRKFASQKESGSDGGYLEQPDIKTSIDELDIEGGEICERVK